MVLLQAAVGVLVDLANSTCSLPAGMSRGRGQNLEAEAREFQGRGRGRGQKLEAEAETEANFWPRGQSGLEVLTYVVLFARCYLA